jgi:hypothetical protein
MTSRAAKGTSNQGEGSKECVMDSRCIIEIEKQYKRIYLILLFTLFLYVAAQLYLMKKEILLLLFSIACLHAKSQNEKSTGTTEPKSTFEVSINGKIYPIAEDETLKLDTILSKPAISVKLSDYKLFDNTSISFNYPRHLSFEFDHDFGYKNWTLSGNTIAILVFEIDAETTLETLVNEMAKKFGKKNCSIEDFQKELGHKKCNGKNLFVTLAGQKLVLECYEIKMADFKSRFIYFQDTMDESKHSSEYEKAMAIINSSIVFK